jgi:hypothetical protein
MKNGGSAFPVLDSITDYEGENPRLECASEGMSLRDRFAGQVITSIIPTPKTAEDFEAMSDFSTVFAETAYEIADAMLAARENK